MQKHNDLMIYHIYTLSLTQREFLNDYHTLSHKCEEIAKWIPHIKKMGFNAVLFAPVLMSRTHGYDVTDYFTIDNRIGTNEEFKELVKEFHNGGIKVILDSVYNHCGRDFSVFQELKNGDRSKAEWFKGVNFDRGSPMGDWFDYETWSGYYELVKFNLQNHNVKDYLLRATKFWIEELDIDGMRLDSANVMDFDFMRELRRFCTDIKPDFWLMGEVVAGEYTNWVNDEMLHSVTGYMLYKALYSAHNANNFYELTHTVQNSRPYNGLPHYNFLDNHDQPRIASIVEKREYLVTLYTLLFTLPGIPSVYYGSEWEFKGVKESGSDAPLRPYIDIDSLKTETNITFLIQKLTEVRSEYKPLRYGTYHEMYIQYHQPFVFCREFEGEKIYVAVNSQEQEHTVSLGEGGEMFDALTGEKHNLNHFTMPPFSSKIFVSKLADPVATVEVAAPLETAAPVVTATPPTPTTAVAAEMTGENIQTEINNAISDLRQRKIAPAIDKLESIVKALQEVITDLKS